MMACQYEQVAIEHWLNAAVATVPLNFHETQMNASKKRHVVDKGDSKSKYSNVLQKREYKVCAYWEFQMGNLDTDIILLT